MDVRAHVERIHHCRFDIAGGDVSVPREHVPKHVEGKRILEPIKGHLADTLREMREDVQSSISYAGGTRLVDIRKVNYVILGGDNVGEHFLM